MPSPHSIDVHVGLRIRQRRSLLGMSMENLGAAVGLSFQMVQKYEAGLYCIPVSRLFELAKALDVPPSFFFEGPRRRALYTRENTGNFRSTAIAPPRCLSAKACGPLQADRLGNLCKCRGCWQLSGLGRPSCGAPARIDVTTIARCARRHRVLIRRRLASQLRGRPTPARPAPRWCTTHAFQRGASL
jgi:Helix-turn-helix